jgi:chromosome segregation ATPase
MDRREVADKMRALEQRREEAEARLRQSEARLAQLEEEQNSLHGELNLGRRALADLDSYHEQLQEEFRLAEIEEARELLDRAVEERTAASEAAAAAARELRASLERLTAARKAVTETRKALRHLVPGPQPLVEPEVSSLDDEWTSLAPLLEQELNLRLQMQVVAAAAESENPQDALSLPRHLQVLVQARRDELRRRAQEEARPRRRLR